MTLPSPPAAVLFDFDGTILDTETSEFETVADEFRRHGMEYGLDEHRASVGRIDHRPWHEILAEQVGADQLEIHEVRNRRAAAHRAMIDATPLRPGVEEMLRRAQEADVALAIASSSPLEWVTDHLTSRGLFDVFSAFANGDMVAHAKPWPDVFLLAAEKLDVDPAGCLVIEDSLNGLTAAKAAGMRCVVVPNPMTVGSDFSEADLVLDSLTDFPWSDAGL